MTNMNKNDVKWKGCFVAVVTPFNKKGEIDEKAFQKNIKFLIKDGVDGIVISGCTGESWALEEEEKIKLYHLGSAVAKGKCTVIAGTPGLFPAEILRLSKGAAEAGCDGIMVQPPACSLPNEKEVFAFFEEVDQGVSLPIMAYNIPRRNGVSMSPEFIAHLATINHIVAVKQSSSQFDEIIETIALAGSKLKVFSGYSAKWGFPITLMGADGFVTSTEPQIFGKMGVDLWTLSAEGKINEARDLQFKIFKLNKYIWKSRGTFPATIKGAMNLLGRPGGYTRPPIKPLGSEDVENIKRFFVEMGLL